ncbi:phosphopantetheine-binding protein [Nonomuraea fastidiosa]|jgi:acyl carrier protein|uniref:phosphopantetheine-binding protein n=1 Tax=Nonomuraea TaxID=83681 RepID=UPI003245692B
MTDDLTGKLVAFVQDNLVQDGDDLTIDAHTPLLSSGLLDSLRTARLLTYLRKDLGIAVPAAKLDPENFRDVATIVAMVAELEAV